MRRAEVRRVAALLSILGLAGCRGRVAHDRGSDLEQRVSTLELQVEKLKNDNAGLELRVSMLEGTAAEAAPVEPPAPSAPAAAGPQCRRTDAGYALSPDDWSAVLKDPLRLAPEVRLVPAQKGVRLLGVRPGGLLASCGFENGDLVEAVNATPFTSDSIGLVDLPAAFSKIGSTLRTASRADVLVERHGGPVHLIVDRKGS